MTEHEKLNTTGIIELAVCTAFLKEDWINETSFVEFYEINRDESLISIIELATEYCEKIGLSNVEISKDDVCRFIWNDSYDNLLTEYGEND